MIEPIRILRVVGKMDRGGLETIIMNSYRVIDKTKIQFDFVVHTNEKCDYDDEIQSLGGKIYRVPKYNGKNHLKYRRAWNDFFKNHKEYKIVHGHIRSTASIYLAIANKYGLTTIAHSHNISSGKNITAFVKNVFQKKIRKIADYLFACSIPAGKWLFGKNVVNKSYFKVVPNGIDVKKYAFSSTKRDVLREKLLLNDNIVVGNVGRFHSQKNHKFLISIFKEIYKQNSKAKLLLVGDGKLRNKIEKWICDFDLSENVLLLGVRNDVPDLLQVMDIFLFPSLFEGFGNVVVEAQSSGLPCLLSNNIPSEVKLTELVSYLDLKEKPIVWSTKVLEILESSNRSNTEDLIFQKGFDIHPITEWYESFYVKIHNGETVDFSN